MGGSIGDSVGLFVRLLEGLSDGLEVGAIESPQEPKVFVSVERNTAPWTAVLPFTRTSYEPFPSPQQSPSPYLSVMVKSYEPFGMQYLSECAVLLAVYMGLLMMVPDPHLLVRDHAASNCKEGQSSRDKNLIKQGTTIPDSNISSSGG